MLTVTQLCRKFVFEQYADQPPQLCRLCIFRHIASLPLISSAFLQTEVVLVSVKTILTGLPVINEINSKIQVIMYNG